MISELNGDFQKNSSSHRPLSQTYGAVAYLNMLPFFWDDEKIQLFATPADLNLHLGSGKLLAGCSSVIAGLRGQLDVLPGFYGVAADLKVESVFFEPFVQRNKSKRRWAEILSNNCRLMNNLEERLHRSCGIFVESDSEPYALKIFSGGASAQSVWLLQTLLLLQGFSSEVVHVSPEIGNLTQSDLHSRLNIGDDLACLLTIGDPALERRMHLGSDPEGFRTDLAQFWNDFCGLPCIFALWFLGGRAENELVKLASLEISSKAQRWQNLDPQQKLKLAVNFLEQGNKAYLAGLLGDDFLIEYLQSLRYCLNTPAYQKSFSLMKTLFEAQHLARGIGLPAKRSAVFQAER